MQISHSTPLSNLLESYPFLREALPRINARFHMLNSPIVRVMIKQATIGEMSRRSGMQEDILIRAIEDCIRERKPN